MGGFFGGGGASAGIGGSTGATDNAILRADGTGGVTLQNSALNIDDPVSPFSITGVASTDIITAVGHNFTTNQGVIFPTLTGGAGLTAATTIYFVRDISGDTFKVSTTSGGAAVNFTTDITAGTVIAIQANVAITNQHSETNSSIVLTPKGTGAFIVGPKPDGTTTGGNARGANAICISNGARTSASQVAAGLRNIVIGSGTAPNADDIILIGTNTSAQSNNTIAIGAQAGGANLQQSSIAIGSSTGCGGQSAVAIGNGAQANANNSVAIGNVASPSNATASIRGQFVVPPFSSIFWCGTTTNATATVLRVGTLTADDNRRLIVAANTALIADIILVARRTDVSGKWLIARRFVGIRRDGSNNTALIGTVQTLGTDQSEGSPTWTFTLSADDTNEALQLEVTGAASETVDWRATAFYRVV